MQIPWTKYEDTLLARLWDRDVTEDVIGMRLSKSKKEIFDRVDKLRTEGAHLKYREKRSEKLTRAQRRKKLAEATKYLPRGYVARLGNLDTHNAPLEILVVDF